MKWSFKIGTVAGTEVRIHVTFFILLAFVAMQGMNGGQGISGAFHAVLFVSAAFLCVLLHEFGHVFAASGYGIRTPDITLLPIGGVARLERMPEKPSQEFVVAICGPLVNVAIAAAIAVFIGFGAASNADFQFGQPGHFWANLMKWNLVMVVFNLIPAFPMDGGRILRALLGFVVDFEKATRWAATLGQTIAVMAVLATLLSGHLNPVLMLIAFFVFVAAGQESAAVSQRTAFQGMRVRDAMITDFRTIQPGALLKDAVDLLLSGSQHDFPMTNENGDLMGIVTRQRLIRALSEHGVGYAADNILEDCPVRVTERMDLVEALTALDGGNCPTLPVTDPVSGKLVGLLTSENVGELLMVRAALRSA